ncbi:hypothetical protein FRC09_018613, partial [Ceratobasidium sp. 395]
DIWARSFSIEDISGRTRGLTLSNSNRGGDLRPVRATNGTTRKRATGGAKKKQAPTGIKRKRGTSGIKRKQTGSQAIQREYIEILDD